MTRCRWHDEGDAATYCDPRAAQLRPNGAVFASADEQDVKGRPLSHPLPKSVRIWRV
jgi:hypothetical protein